MVCLGLRGISLLHRLGQVVHHHVDGKVSALQVVCLCGHAQAQGFNTRTALKNPLKNTTEYDSARTHKEKCNKHPRGQAAGGFGGWASGSWWSADSGEALESLNLNPKPS